MAFLSQVGSILKQSASKQTVIGSQISASNPSIYQALRCMSTSKVFVGGLPWAVDDSSLREAFSKYGDVIDAKVIIDREQDRSRGFGFVTFASTEEASSAIQAMDGQDLQGRRVTVNYATERAPRSFGGGFGGGGYGGSGGYGGGGYGDRGGGYGGGGYGDRGGGYGGGQQNYGGGGGYGGQYGGGNIGGYEGGVTGESGNSFYSGGGNNGGNEGGVAGGSGDSFYGGGGGGNVGADPELSHLVGNDAGDFNPSDQPQGNLKDDEPEDLEKRA